MAHRSDAPQSWRDAAWLQMATVGVTGTNGKTSTVGFIDAMAEAAGRLHGRVTTLGAWVQGEQLADDTRFEAFSQALDQLGQVALTSAEAPVMTVEMTSQALGEGFAFRWPPRVAVFTGLSRDHLDVHASMEAYLAAKAQLFMALKPGSVAVLNGADPQSALIAEVIPDSVSVRAFCVGESAPSGLPIHLRATELVGSPMGLDMTIRGGDLARALNQRLHVRVPGLFQAGNALAATLAAEALGLPADAIVQGLITGQPPPGRFQVVAQAPAVVVDYAHNPDGLRRALEAARALVGLGGRVRCVFGCGGERDVGKRPLMGAAAEAGADVVYLTGDNPRRETPAAIAEGVLKGATDPERWRVLLDRREAIQRAVLDADREDVVLIAGRGHEQVQDIGGVHMPFDDVEEARAALGQRPPRSDRET